MQSGAFSSMRASGDWRLAYLLASGDTNAFEINQPIPIALAEIYLQDAAGTTYIFSHSNTLKTVLPADVSSFARINLHFTLLATTQQHNNTTTRSVIDRPTQLATRASSRYPSTWPLFTELRLRHVTAYL